MKGSARFRLQRRSRAGSPAGVKRSRFRRFLYVLLLASAVFAGLAWFLPYEWGPDPGARYRVLATQVKRDRVHYWVTVHLRKTGEEGHDLRKPVRLVFADGRELEPADTIFQGKGMSEIWFKFWLEEEEVGRTFSLKMNDGVLQVKSKEGVPKIADALMRTFTSHRW